ncbi:MAG: hypothetical protein ABI345_04055, partial [Jatrophihabitans sp.]
MLHIAANEPQEPARLPDAFRWSSVEVRAPDRRGLFFALGREVPSTGWLLPACGIDPKGGVVGGDGYEVGDRSAPADRHMRSGTGREHQVTLDDRRTFDDR